LISMAEAQVLVLVVAGLRVAASGLSSESEVRESLLTCAAAYDEARLGASMPESVAHLRRA
jgi:hypothetical protein